MFKLKAIKRKINIDEVAMQMASLESIMYEAWKTRNNLTSEQRALVLANLVEHIKQETANNKSKAEKKLSKAERTDDIVKGISLFSMF